MNNDKYKEAFKACPFCGSGRVDMVTGVMYEGWKFWRAYCINCQMRTEPIKSKQEAIDRWNTRQSDQPQMAELKSEQSEAVLSGDICGVCNKRKCIEDEDWCGVCRDKFYDELDSESADTQGATELESEQSESIDSEGEHHD